MRYAHQKKASQGHDWPMHYIHCISFKYQGQGQIDGVLLNYAAKGRAQKMRFLENLPQILYKNFQKYEPLCVLVFPKNLANHIKSFHLLIILLPNEGIEMWIT